MDIPDNIPVSTNEDVIVPINLTTNGNSIASLTFSIDYDEANLAFDETDADMDGVPDSITVNIPGAFGASVGFDDTDADGELDFTIYDPFPPFSTLPDGTLAEITFTAVGQPQPGQTIVAPVSFSNEPTASFGDTNAQDIPGTTNNGSVEISP